MFLYKIMYKEGEIEYFLGFQYGENLKEACVNFFNRPFMEEDKMLFNSEKLTYDGLKLYTR